MSTPKAEKSDSVSPRADALLSRKQTPEHTEETADESAEDREPKYWDAHSHWSSEKLQEEDLERWRSECRTHAIAGTILGGVHPLEWERQKALCRKHPDFFRMSFGVHPWTASHLEPEALEAALSTLEREVRAAPSGLVALGELGLDHARRFGDSEKERQKTAFERQLDLLFRLRSEGSSLAAVFHVVGASAHSEVWNRLEACMPQGDGAGEEPWGILHSFSGTLDEAARYQSLGLIPSVSLGVLGRSKGKSFETIKRTVLELSLTEFVLETDAPDQPPAGEERNHPANLVRLAGWLAEWRGRGETADEILEASTRTIHRIFHRSTR